MTHCCFREELPLLSSSSSSTSPISLRKKRECKGDLHIVSTRASLLNVKRTSQRASEQPPPRLQQQKYDLAHEHFFPRFEIITTIAAPARPPASAAHENRRYLLTLFSAKVGLEYHHHRVDRALGSVITPKRNKFGREGKNGLILGKGVPGLGVRSSSSRNPCYQTLH